MSSRRLLGGGGPPGPERIGGAAPETTQLPQPQAAAPATPVVPPWAGRVVESTASVKNWMVERFDEIPAKRCPCGWTRRAFATPDNQTATIHYVDIQDDAKTHYHRKLTEIYLILETEGECFMELDGERVPVRPLTTIFIKPGCRHRAVGKMKIVNIPVPAFDPEDEHFD